MHSKLAYIHPDAQIGKNVVIEPFATIRSNTVIGDGCWIGPNAVIWEGARLGKNVKIYSGASISSIPQDLKFMGEETETFIGDGTSVREFVTINRGTVDKYKTVVGKNCLLMAYAHVAHDCFMGDYCILVNSVQVGGHVEIGDWAIVGGCSTVHQFKRVGMHAMIASNTTVRKDVPPYIRAGREPLSYAGINIIGLKRRAFSTQQISNIENTYYYIFSKGLNYSDALRLIDKEMPPSFERDAIVNFIHRSKNGILKSFLNVSVDIPEKHNQ